MTKLISHEVPPVLLDKSLEFNDYDYFLIHLLTKDSRYMDFFKKSKSLDRMQILDNSACELRGKKEFDFDSFAEYIYILQPSEYLIPDVFNDYEKNMSYFEKWMEAYYDLPGKKIATLHGKTYDEICKAYKYFSHAGVKIAFNFDECIYTAFNFHENPAINKSLNRIHLIYQMLMDGVIDDRKEHHLLGCHVPQEFTAYQCFDWIKTVDTSHPIMAALDRCVYTPYRASIKTTTNIDTCQDIDQDDISLAFLEVNVKLFRSFVNDTSSDIKRRYFEGLATAKC